MLKNPYPEPPPLPQSPKRASVVTTGVTERWLVCYSRFRRGLTLEAGRRRCPPCPRRDVWRNRTSLLQPATPVSQTRRVVHWDRMPLPTPPVSLSVCLSVSLSLPWRNRTSSLQPATPVSQTRCGGGHTRGVFVHWDIIPLTTPPVSVCLSVSLPWRNRTSSLEPATPVSQMRHVEKSDIVVTASDSRVPDETCGEIGHRCYSQRLPCPR